MAHFTLVQAVLLTIDSATQSGYSISEPEIEHAVDCTFGGIEDDDEDDEDDETEEVETEEVEEVVQPVRAAPCSCKVAGYDLTEVGMVRTASQRQDVADSAVESAVGLGLPLIVVREHWTRHGLSNVSFESLLMGAGEWKQALGLAGAHTDMIVPVLPEDWRRPLFGPLKGLKRPQLKKKAHDYVQQVLKLPPYSEDICEALCIREWGSRADVAHALLKGVT